MTPRILLRIACAFAIVVLPGVSAAIAGEITRSTLSNPLFNPYVPLRVDTGARSVAIGDVTGDGLNDLVAIQTEKDSVQVFTQNGSGGLNPAVRYHVPIRSANRGSVDIADMNHDGRLDVLLALEDSVGVMLQTPGGLLSSPILYPTEPSSASNSYLVRSGDFNNDGWADAVSIDWGTQSQDVDVFLQNGSGSLVASDVVPVTHDGYDDLEVRDVNGDGRDDIIVMNGQGSPHLGILLQKPGGGFHAPDYLAISETPSGIGVGDVNHDGRNDVVVSYGGNVPNSNISVLLQEVSGNLGAPFSLPSFDIPLSVEVADVNHDGRDDVLTLHGGWLKLGVYVQGDTGLEPEQLYPIPYASYYAPHALAIGDLNNDSWPDVAIADYNPPGGGVTILYNTTLGLPVGVGVLPAADVALALHGTLPSPSGKNLNVSFTLPIAAPTTLELLDVSGRRIVSRDVGALGAGAHVVDLTPQQALGSGVYWLRLTQGSRVRTAKVVVR
jgi:hypothetical protein